MITTRASKWIVQWLPAAGMLLGVWWHAQDERVRMVAAAVIEERRLASLEAILQEVKVEVRDLRLGIQAIPLRGYHPQ